jgi:hypothetical protein
MAYFKKEGCPHKYSGKKLKKKKKEGWGPDTSS